MRELPTGTVTFLFSDVEGSTRLLHELGAEGYADALAEHRRVIRAACAREGGVEVDTQGDAFFFAFPTAPGALTAAQAATEALAAGRIQVRIGLHTGRPLVTEEGYVGDDVHFAARVAAASHGGQVVLSRATREQLDEDVALSDLGEHRLKDLPQAVSIFQLGAGSFPPLKTISNTNLPRPASSFVGRERELAEVLARVQGGARLVTLTGPGGSGKTRLALEAAATLVPEYKAGVFWVGLAALRDPALVTETVAQTLGAKDGLQEHIGERELLLLLDNLEQVVEAAPELSSLVAACPHLTLLVTSRELLRVQGEVEYPVPPLAEPEAVSLFCERAQLGPSEEIAQLCARLDSLPLAVELAAARTKALSPAQILARLSQRLDLFKGGRDADPRQQTLRATIEWSYDLLSPEEQRVFTRLSVFAGGCTLEAAEQVCDADLDTLQSLVEKSLLRFSTSEAGSRYWMLETIREYAGVRLEASGEGEESLRRHTDFVLKLASRLEAAFGSDAEHGSFVLEQDNFRAALARAELAGDADTQLQLIGRSWPFWWYRGLSSEGLRWVESALALSEGERSERMAKVLAAGAMFAYRRGELGAMKVYAAKSLGIARKMGDKRNTIWPLIFLGLWATEAGDYDEARNLDEEAIGIAREAGERKLVGIAMNNLGVVSQLRGDFVGAAALFEEALTISRELSTSDETALETLNLAQCLYFTGRLREAAENAKEGLALARRVGNLASLGDGFILLGALARRQGSTVVAGRLLGVAEVLENQVGEAKGLEAALIETTAKELLLDLGEEGYARALAEGKAMPLDEAVEYALASID